MIAQGPSNGPFGGAPGPHVDPAVAIDFFDDFFEVRKNSSDEIGWLVTAIQGTNTAVVSTDIGYGGELAITTGTNDGDGDQLQWHHVIVAPVASSELWFACRLNLVNLDSDFAVGLANSNTDPFGTGITDAIYFLHEAAGTLKAICEETAEGATTLDSDLTANTWTELGFRWNGTNVRFYQDGSLVATYATTANIPIGVSLAPFIALITSADAARAVVVDWIRCVQIRVLT